MSKVLGIDLGTTNSCMAIMEGGSPVVIANAQGGRTTPSIVAITKDGERIVGTPAKNQMVTNPKNTIYSIKRLIGRRWKDKEAQQDIKMLPFEAREADNGGIEIKMGDKWHTPQEVSAMVLGKMKADAEAYIGEEIKDAVITVPAYFDDAQRKATKDAGKIAGLNVLRVFNEPTAAALAYGMDKKDDEKIVVYDLGGGTFDVSILEIGDGVFEVLSTNGDTHLGGDNFDQTIINFLADEFKKTEGIDLREDPVALQRLKEASEKAKIELSSSEQTSISLPFITADASGPKHLNREMKRAELEKLVKDLVDKTIEPCEKALKDAGLKKEDIDQVLLVGGMTRMPLVQKTVKELFGKEPNKGVNPDEVVGVGAAVQGGVLVGDVKDVTLLDVTPLSLGIEVNHGQMHVMIPRNTTIPTEKKDDRFTTAVDNQPAIDVRVFQGERPMCADNKLLGEFTLDGIPAAPRGIPRFEVIFDIDANGILHVSAKDLGTGKEKKIPIKATTGLSDDEVGKMVEEAAKHASEDKKKKDTAEARNEADTLCFTIERTIKDLGDKISEDDKKSLEEKVKEIKELLSKEDTDIEELKKKTESLNKEMQDISVKLYEAQSKESEKAGEAKSDEKTASTGSAQASEEKKPEEGEIVE